MYSASALSSVKRERAIAYCALIFWFVSLVLPTMRSDKGPILGYELFLKGAELLIGIIFAPIHGLSWLTNILLFMQFFRIVFPNHTKHKPSLGAMLASIAMNITVALFFGGSIPQGPYTLLGLNSMPGYYVWLSSFILTAFAANVATTESSLT